MYRPFLRAAFAVLLSFSLAAGAQAELDTSVPDLPSYMAPMVTQSLLLDGMVVDGRIYAVGEHGHILVSTDDGANWTQQSVPTRSALTGVYFVDSDNGWAVGHDAIILKTSDGGTTWKKVHYDPMGETPLLDVWFADANRGIAVGAYGLYLTTMDGGESWMRRPFFSSKLPTDPAGLDDADGEGDMDEEEDFVDPEYGEDFHLNNIVSAGNGMLYIAAELGHFYRSEDGGEVWYSIPVDYGGSFFATIPLGGDSLLLAGMRGNLFRSENNGLGLQPIDSGTEALLSGGFATVDGRVVISGTAGALLESNDLGRTFELYGQNDRKSIMTVLPASDEAVILIGAAGVARMGREDYQAGGK